MKDVGRIVVQTFDEALRPYSRDPSRAVHSAGRCVDVAVLEHDGGFYMRHDFVDPDHLVGNLKERGISELTGDPRLRRFGQDKRDALPRNPP